MDTNGFPSCCLQSSLSLGQTRWCGVENPKSHCVSLHLSVTEGTLRSLAELQEAVLQCPVSDPMALPASCFPSVVPFCQAIGLSSLLCSAAGQRPEQLLQHRACGELRGGIPATAAGCALEDFGSGSPHNFAGEQEQPLILLSLAPSIHPWLATRFPTGLENQPQPLCLSEIPCLWAGEGDQPLLAHWGRPVLPVSWCAKHLLLSLLLRLPLGQLSPQ